MLEDDFPEYLRAFAAILVIISVTAYLLPSRIAERISDIALGAFVGVVFLGLLLSVPHLIGIVR